MPVQWDVDALEKMLAHITDGEEPNETGCIPMAETSTEEVIDMEMECEEHSISKSAVATNLISKIYLTKDGDFNDEKLSAFKKDTHCSQEVVIYYGNSKDNLMRYGCKKIVEISKNIFNEIFKRASIISLVKKEPKKSVLHFFFTNDISGKRCLVKCHSIVHGLALVQKDREIARTVLSERKRNNQFSNYQRPDRAAGQQLVKDFKKKHRLSSFPDRSEIEQKTGSSFDIYDQAGFLTESSEKLQATNAVFYQNKTCLYIVKEKYLDAFGKVIVKKRGGRAVTPRVKVQESVVVKTEG